MTRDRSGLWRSAGSPTRRRLAWVLLAGALSLVPGLVRAQTVVSAATTNLTLEAAIQLALVHSPDTRIAAQRVVAAQGMLQQANAAFWPTLQLNSSYLVSDNPVTVFGMALNQRSYSPSMDFNDVPSSDNLNLNGQVKMPLYTGGQSRAGRNAAQAGTEAARKMSEAVRLQLAFAVTRAFYTVQKTAEYMDATRAAVEAYEAAAGVAKKRGEGGAALKSEALDVQVRLAQAKEDDVRARNAHALALRALRNLLGVEWPLTQINPAGPEMVVPGTEDYSQRPDLVAAQRRVEAAEYGVRRAQGKLLPQVAAFGRYDYDYGWKFSGSGQSYSAGIQFQWDLWDGMLTHGRVSEARALLEATREEERKLRLAVQLEVEQARLNVSEADERLRVTASVVEQASESARLTRTRFEQGLALSTQLIDAEVALTTARVRRAEAEAERRIAVAAYRAALGLPLFPTF